MMLMNYEQLDSQVSFLGGIPIMKQFKIYHILALVKNQLALLFIFYLDITAVPLFLYNLAYPALETNTQKGRKKHPSC